MSRPPDMTKIRVQYKRRKYVQESVCGTCGELVERPCKNAAETAFCPRVGKANRDNKVAETATIR